jgi:polyisoprenoid-binding protein YceI
MYLRLIFTPLIALILTTGSLLAQDLTLNLQPNSELSIEGSSNVRDWGAEAETVQAQFSLQGIEELNLETLNPDQFASLELTVPVEGLDSGSRGLTNNIHKYLKESDYPNITFTLSEVTNVEYMNGSAQITATGVVNAAGNDHEITMTVEAQQEGNTLIISGSQELLMTSFDIDPPTALLGTIRAHDEFTVLFNVRFSQ